MHADTTRAKQIQGRSSVVDVAGKWDEWISGGDVSACDVPPGTVFKVIRGAKAWTWTDSARNVGGQRNRWRKKDAPDKPLVEFMETT